MKNLPSSIDRNLTYDSEANGFLNFVTRMWCVVAEDYDTGEVFLFHDFPQYDNYEGTDDIGEAFTLPERDGTLRDGVMFINNAKQLICHNQIGYDMPLMKKFYPFFRLRHNYPEIRDTMLESQVQWYDRPAVKGYKGIHGLAVWGARLGIRKTEVEDWTTMDAEKLWRCLQDVKINTMVAKALVQERLTIEGRVGIDFASSLRTEHVYRYWCSVQEFNGALVNRQHMRDCVIELDGLIEVLRAKIEPQLPPTLKWKATKTTANEAASAVGIKKPPPIRYVWKERKGKQERFSVKTFHKPCTKWWTATKSKEYTVTVDGNLVDGGPFEKLKDAREWAKGLYPKAKLKYPSKEKVIKAFDSNTRTHFGKQKLKEIKIIGPFTKLTWIPSKMSQHEKVKLLLVSLGWDTDEWTLQKDEDGHFVRADCNGTVVWPPYKINGNQLSCAYKRGEAIPVTPKISKDSHATLPDGLGQQIKEYNAYSHRRIFIENPEDKSKGLLNNIRDDGRITCGLMSFGTTAGRASHNGWVNAPGLKAIYGKQIREIIVAPPGHTLVGIDMPSAHPRLLADFTGNQTFIDAVDGSEVDPDTGLYVGEDFHTVNSVLFKLNTQDQVNRAVLTQDDELISFLSLGRGTGKGGSYATLYGGSGKKIALTLGLPVKEGEQLKIDFLAGLGLDALLKEITQDWKARKWGRGSYITVLGDYNILCASKHKIINYKALGSEAVVQKYAVIWMCEQMEKHGVKSKLILNMHDELLFECPDDEVELMVELASAMYPAAALQLGLTLNWKSAAMTGVNYAKCH